MIKLQKSLEDTNRFQSDPAGQVINLSTKRFCKDTFKLSNKNLNFVPTQKTINKDTTNKQFEDFFRRIKLRAFFKNKKNTNLSFEEDRFKKQTSKNWIPTNNHHCIDTFTEATRNEIQEVFEKTQPSKYWNLTIKEQKAMQELQSWYDIVKTDVDNGATVVILDVEDYIKEAETQLSNNDGPKTENLKTPHFYLKPKLHKYGNTGRPMVSSISCHTSRISEYIDYHLQ